MLRRPMPSLRPGWSGASPPRADSIEVPLANFGAVITEDILVDDGVSEQRQLVLEATVRGQTLQVAIPAAQFAGMSWVADRLGAGAILEPGMGTKDRLRHAMQVLSGDIPQRRVYAHTGWRQIDGAWVYLHAGGAIGADGRGPRDRSHPQPALARMALPDPARERISLLRCGSALQLLDLLPLAVALPAPRRRPGWRPCASCSVLTLRTSSLWLHGPSGVFKSEYLALAMAFYGDFSRTSLPANFSATANAIERFTFETKDALLAIDDFHPAGDRQRAGRHEPDRQPAAAGSR